MSTRQETVERQDAFIRQTAIVTARQATQRARMTQALKDIERLPIGASISHAQKIAREALNG